MMYYGKDNERSTAPRHAGLILLALSVFFHPGDLAGQMRMNSPDAPFELSISQRNDREKGILIRVNAAVDYRSLIFFRKTGFYQADLRVYLNIEDRENGEVRGEVWEESVAASSYMDTRSISLKASVKRDFPIEPGRYRVGVIIEMLGSSRKISREVDIRITGADDDAVRIENPVFSMPGRRGSDDSPPAGELRVSRCDTLSDNFIHLQDQSFLEFDSWIRVYLELLAPTSLDRGADCDISIKISDRGGRVKFYNTFPVDIEARSLVGLCTDINADELEIGSYDLSISAVIRETGIKTERNDSFDILLNRRLLGKDFPRLLELLSLVADDEDLESLRGAPASERLEQWNQFWRRRDTSPGTVVNEQLSEFLVRLKFALNTFSKSRPGWDTDMGRVYIRHGRPDRMLDRSGTSFNYGSEYQLWYYDRMSIVYIFRNTMHGGEYRLVETRYY
ncbi:MAG: GWxTD domain-containing protein [Candidatus Krumholzibacteriota bacterium]|nr:GWxTD domain-containing protein [Candidatus Krumholzibacteriota bacterium]